MRIQLYGVSFVFTRFLLAIRSAQVFHRTYTRVTFIF